MKELNSIEEVTSLLRARPLVLEDGILAFEEVPEDVPVGSDMQVH